MLPEGELPRQPVDPIALLKREHEIILDRLRRIDRVVGPVTEKRPAERKRRLAPPVRAALRKLLGFFTDRMAVHFEREEILIQTLVRVLGSKQAKREGLEDLEREHQSLQTETNRIIKLLHTPQGGSISPDGADPARVRSFVHHYGWHLFWEERILFHLAETRLTATQKRKVVCNMLQV